VISLVADFWAVHRATGAVTDACLVACFDCSEPQPKVFWVPSGAVPCYCPYCGQRFRTAQSDDVLWPFSPAPEEPSEN